MKLMALVGTQGRADVDAVVAEFAYQAEHHRLLRRVRALFPALTPIEAQRMVLNIEDYISQSN